jgi:hypothetical protein
MRTIVLGLMVVLAACGSDSNLEKIIKQGEAFTDRLCACTDAECVQKVYDELEAWKETLPSYSDEEAKMSPEERDKAMTRIKASSFKSKECLEKWKGQYRRRG